MRSFFVFLLYSMHIFTTVAQSGTTAPRIINKPIIDSSAIKHWVSLREPVISNNGKHFAYSILNQPAHSSTVVLQSTEGSLKKEFPGATSGTFSADSREFIFLAGDTLCILQLETGQARYVNFVSGYKQPVESKGQWLAYKLKNTNDELVLRNLLTGKEKHFNSVIDYLFDQKGNMLLLKTVTGQGDSSVTSLVWLSLLDVHPVTIWSGIHSTIGAYNIDFDPSGTQVAFIVQSTLSASNLKIKQPSNTLWYFKKGMEKAIMKAHNKSEGLEPGLFIDNSAPRFNQNGRYIFFQLQKPELREPKADAVSLDIWSYLDTILQCTQLDQLSTPTYNAVTSIEENNVIRLTYDYEVIETYEPVENFVVISNDKLGDRFWLDEFYDSSCVATNWLVALKDGSRKLLPAGRYTQFYFSPAGKYLVYYDWSKHNYYSYDLNKDKIYNISGSISVGKLAYQDEYVRNRLAKMDIFPVGIAGWQEQDLAVLVYDKYDIWKLDLAGKVQPVNITNGYGRLHNIKFRLTVETSPETFVFQSEDTLLLTAFNTITKYNGFYGKSPGKKGNPELLTMGPWTLNHSGKYLFPLNANLFDYGMIPLKAKDVNVWIVKRQSATEAPNYFFTTDFKSYKVLTDLQHHKKFNWLTAELIGWKQQDGTFTQGILYKPENFDPDKKYPILFNYYQQLSHRLYEFPRPHFTSHNIDIPWFVSRGYLIFTPDIHYTVGQSSGKSALNFIVSAVKHLAKHPWVDTSRMGLNGHSFGGAETNYIITHSTLFAAAVEGAGVSNAISSALQLSHNRSRLASAESQRPSMWERPDLYIENSSVLRAHKVTTPLIIFHSKDDNAVPWAQGLELFIALRRLGKKVWMLQYDGQDHHNEGKAAEDYTLRITQFFDHYLKGAYPPVWMTKGLPARLKFIDTGFELNTGSK